MGFPINNLKTYGIIQIHQTNNDHGATSGISSWLTLTHIRIYIYIYTTEKLKNIYGSSIAEHVINNRDCAENFCLNLFSIQNKSYESIGDNSYYADQAASH